MIIELLEKYHSGKELDIYISGFILFAKYGIKKVTVGEICQEANVSKMTFYKYFKNKNELSLKFIKLFFGEIKKNSISILENEDIDSRTRFLKIALEERNALKELGEELLQSVLSLPVAQEYFQEFRNETWLLLKDFIEKKQQEKVLSSSFKPILLKIIIEKVWEMLGNQELRKHYKNIDELMVEIDDVLFLGILSREENKPSRMQ